MPSLKIGARIFLDDYRRAPERRIVRNWLSAYPGAVSLVEVVEEGDHVAVLQKTAEAASPSPSFSRWADAHWQAFIQPLTSRVRTVSMRLQGKN
jgi:hypothetical protein